MGYRIVPYLIAASWVVLCFCRNPFFPETTVPDKPVGSGLRATPKGVLDQLIKSYESKQIELFKDLFPADSSFRFFIAPDFYDEYRLKNPVLKEPRDSLLQNLEASDYYYYWPQSVEIKKHAKLFSPGITIDFRIKPTVGSVRLFIYEGDSAAELLVTGGVLDISRDLLDTIEIYTTSIEKQVMLVKKGSDELWTLNKWYDFSGGE